MPATTAARRPVDWRPTHDALRTRGRHCRRAVRGIAYIDVQIRDSVVSRSADGPPLQQHHAVVGGNGDLDEWRERLATTVGLPISARATPGVAGTGGFFVEDSVRLLVTARHVVLPS